MPPFSFICPRNLRGHSQSTAGDAPSIATSMRKANAFHFWYMNVSVIWILGTDAILEHLAMPTWVGSIKDIFYLGVCGLVLRRAVTLYLNNLRREHRVEIEGKRDLVQRLAMAAEYRDDETGGHNQRIGRSAQIVGKAMGLSEETSERLFYAASLHDIGKIAVPDGILHKPGALTPEERRTMQRHTGLGAELLANSPHPLLQMAHNVALGHHERWDGTGYPNGLSGTAIPLEARIVAVCDVFDALTSERPYKRAWTVKAAIDEIRRQSGCHFDPAVVEAFLRCYDGIVEATGEETPPHRALQKAA